MDPSILKIGGLGLFFLAVLGVMWSLFSQRKSGAPSQFEAQAVEPGEATKFVNIFRPLFPVFAPLAKRLPIEGYRKRVNKLSITADIDRELGVNDFIAFQMVMMCLFLVCGLFLFSDAISAVLLALLGIVYPYLWLYEKKKTRQQDIARSMPDVVDMLSLSVEAGLDFIAGVKRIGDVNRSANDPFITELTYMYQNIKLGMGTDEALNVMAERVDIQEMYSFTSILVQAQKMGSSIGETLKSQAERMRQQRFMKAERMGAVASQKLLIPMMLCIFPILFIVIFGPYLLKYIYG